MEYTIVDKPIGMVGRARSRRWKRDIFDTLPIGKAVRFTDPQGCKSWDILQTTLSIASRKASYRISTRRTIEDGQTVLYAWKEPREVKQ